jgi:choline-sulfatase
VPRAVSLVDLLPTLADIAGCGAEATAAAPLDGASLMPLARGTARGAADAVLAEYTAEGTTEPLFMIRRGRHKFVAGRGDPPLLFDVVADPHELRNLAGRREHAARVDAFAREVERTWDADRLRAEVIASQRARTFVQAALLEGRVTPWDYEPREDAARRYNRNYGGELYDTDRRARLPFRPEPAKDGRGRA